MKKFRPVAGGLPMAVCSTKLFDGTPPLECMTGCLFHRKLSQSYKTLQNSIFLGVLYATKLGSFKSHNSHSSTLCFPSSTFDASCDRQIPWTC